MTALSVRPEGPLDGPSIEHLLDLSFGIDRRRKISYRYRFGVAPVEGLCLVAEDGPIGMVGAIFMLHFGLFHLLSLAWRHAGVNAVPLMRNRYARRHWANSGVADGIRVFTNSQAGSRSSRCGHRWALSARCWRRFWYQD